MNVLDQYIINPKTVVIIPKFDELGRLCSSVIEGDQTFLVKQTPKQIIEQSIQYYGHTLKGAIEGAREALGNVSAAPVKVSGKLGMYWFPHKSSTHDDCVWFAIDHINNFFAASKDTTKVILSDGHDITIDINYSRFEKQVSRARNLKNIHEGRTNGNKNYLSSQKKGYQIIKDPGGVHYRITRKEDKKET